MTKYLSLTLAGLLVAGGLLPPPVLAQPAAQRDALDRCVNQQLTKLAPSRPSDTKVASEVLGRCDKQLRAVLAASIKTGEAAPCTSVEECLPKARARMAQEVAIKFRQFAPR